LTKAVTVSTQKGCAMRSPFVLRVPEIKTVLVLTTNIFLINAYPACTLLDFPEFQ